MPTPFVVGNSELDVGYSDQRTPPFSIQEFGDLISSALDLHRVPESALQFSFRSQQRFSLSNHHGAVSSPPPSSSSPLTISPQTPLPPVTLKTSHSLSIHQTCSVERRSCASLPPKAHPSHRYPLSRKPSHKQRSEQSSRRVFARPLPSLRC